MTIILATLVGPLSSMIYANIQPQSILGSREEDLYMGMAAILVNELWPF